MASKATKKFSRSHTLPIRLTEAEFKKLEQNAEKKSEEMQKIVSMAELIRNTCCS